MEGGARDPGAKVSSDVNRVDAWVHRFVFLGAWYISRIGSPMPGGSPLSRRKMTQADLGTVTR